MDNLKTIEGKVKAVLQKNEDARNDDMVLYLALCNLYLADAGNMPLAQILTNHKEPLILLFLSSALVAHKSEDSCTDCKCRRKAYP